MNYKKFVEEFEELEFCDKLAIFNEYCIEYGDSDKAVYGFDEEFFETCFNDPMEIARATYFGDIKSWSDEYIRFNVYGNLESLTKYDIDNEIDDCLKDIFEHEDVWDNFIDNNFYEGDEEELEDEEVTDLNVN